MDNSTRATHVVVSALPCACQDWRQALCATSIPCCSITQHLGAFQQPGATLHGLMGSRLVQTLSGCLEKSECGWCQDFSRCDTLHVSHTAQAARSCCPLAHSVCFHTWLSERARGENAASSTDLRSWVRNISSVVSFTFCKSSWVWNEDQ